MAQVCSDAYCASIGQGPLIGCFKSLDTGEAACECEPESGCTVDDEMCQGNTLIFCDFFTGQLQTQQCSDAACAEAGLGPLIGCQMDETGLLNCVCQL